MHVIESLIYMQNPSCKGVWKGQFLAVGFLELVRVWHGSRVRAFGVSCSPFTQRVRHSYFLPHRAAHIFPVQHLHSDVPIYVGLFRIVCAFLENVA